MRSPRLTSSKTKSPNPKLQLILTSLSTYTSLARLFFTKTKEQTKKIKFIKNLNAKTQKQNKLQNENQKPNSRRIMLVISVVSRHLSGGVLETRKNIFECVKVCFFFPLCPFPKIYLTFSLFTI